MKRLAPLALLGLLVACRDPAPARDQWLVTVTTDAPLPQFGDRLLVEILDEEGELACPSCRRVLGIRTEDLPLSFGIAAREEETWLRVRLYRADHTGNDGFPSSEALVDALGILPDVGGVREVSLALTLDCFGRVANPVAGTACDPTTGEVDAIGELTDSPVLVAGSWWGSQRRACGP
ncbi:MAG: hypothetical protein KC731_13905, partial [Myxococcales bacterium]|nr:hypothetical protein [Myxococcales bacterium]